jgi:hypothetical protein
VKKARDQGELLIHKSQAIEDHRFDRLAERDHTLGGVLGNRLVNNRAEKFMSTHLVVFHINF